MSVSDPNPVVDSILHKEKRWKREFEELRRIIQSAELKEELKWCAPCYTLLSKNILLIHGFKEYCAILFFKGALMDDPKKLLIQQTANVQSARQIRFTSVDEILKLESTLKKYIKNAIKVEKEGGKVEFKSTREFEMPEEFAARLKKDAKLKKAFESLTPGRQRAYLLHFSSAKQTTTRESRIENARERILVGKGLLD